MKKKNYSVMFLIFVLLFEMVMSCSGMEYQDLLNPLQLKSDIEFVEMNLISNISEDKTIRLYDYNSQYYIAIQELGQLTRVWQEHYNNKISLKQGIWTGYLDIDEQTFTDPKRTIPISIIGTGDGRYAVPALPFLRYFHTISEIEGDTLICIASPYTVWETLNLDFDDTSITIEEVYGEGEKYKFFLASDIFIDFIMGEMKSGDTYVDDAFLETLKVDISESDLLKNYLIDLQKSMVKLLQEEDVLNMVTETKNHKKIGEMVVNLLDNMQNLAWVPATELAKLYFKTMSDSYLEFALNAVKNENFLEFEEMAQKHFSSYTKITKIPKNLKTISSYTEVAVSLISCGYYIYEQCKYTDSTNNLVYKAMGKETLQYLDIQEEVKNNTWFSKADNYKNMIGVTLDSIMGEAIKYANNNFVWDGMIGGGC